MSDFGLVLVLAGATYMIRASLVVLLADVTIPDQVQQALRLVAPAVLAGLVAQTLVVDGAEGAAIAPWYVALVIAAIIAWRTRSVAWTLIVGMGAVWALEAILG